jgi:hypothetical protein
LENEEREIEKYVNAVKKALEEAPVHKGDIVDVSDLWVITSLPMDLIMECLKSDDFKMPSHIRKITHKRKVILKNENYIPLADREKENDENNEDNGDEEK